MNIDPSLGSRPKEVAPRGRPPSVTRSRSRASSEVVQAAPTGDRLPDPRELRLGVPARDDVRTEVPLGVRTVAPHERLPTGLPSGDHPARHAPSRRQRLQQALSTPGAARQAFLLSEVIGRPVSLRADTVERTGQVAHGPGP